MPSPRRFHQSLPLSFMNRHRIPAARSRRNRAGLGFILLVTLGPVAIALAFKILMP